MKKSFLLVLLAICLFTVPVLAQTDELSLEERVTNLELLVTQLSVKIDDLLLTLDNQVVAEPTTEEVPASNEPVKSDPTMIHHMEDVVLTSMGEFTMLSATVNKEGVLDIKFRMTNTTDEMLDISSWNFKVKNDDGLMLESDYSCKQRFDGMVLPGDKLTGSVCFQYIAPAPLKIYYEIDKYEGDIVVWELTE